MREDPAIRSMTAALCLCLTALTWSGDAAAQRKCTTHRLRLLVSHDKAPQLLELTPLPRCGVPDKRIAIQIIPTTKQAVALVQPGAVRAELKNNTDCPDAAPVLGSNANRRFLIVFTVPADCAENSFRYKIVMPDADGNPLLLDPVVRVVEEALFVAEKDEDERDGLGGYLAPIDDTPPLSIREKRRMLNAVPWYRRAYWAKSLYPAEG